MNENQSYCMDLMRLAVVIRKNSNVQSIFTNHFEIVFSGIGREGMCGPPRFGLASPSPDPTLNPVCSLQNVPLIFRNNSLCEMPCRKHKLSFGDILCVWIKFIHTYLATTSIVYIKDDPSMDDIFIL